MVKRAELAQLIAWRNQLKAEVARDRMANSLIDGRGDGLSAFDVAVHDVATFMARAEKLGLTDAQGVITACGTRIYPRPA